MFGKKRKIEKADELRQRANRSTKKVLKLIDRWTDEVEHKTGEEEAELNKKYDALVAEANKISDADYKKYYDFVFKNFKKSKIAEAVEITQDFMGKTFINLLKK